jgi:hypothetical protein
MQNAPLRRSDQQRSTLYLYQPKGERLRVVTPRSAASFLMRGAKGGYLMLGDYNGDTAQDVAIFNRGTWSLHYNQSQRYLSSAQVKRKFGGTNSLPAVGDFDGDGRSDLATVQRQGRKLLWMIRRSANGRTQKISFGASSATPLTGDFNGDGRSDLVAVQNGVWTVLDIRSQEVLRTFSLPRGGTVVSDYDGDGRADAAIFNRSGWSLFLSGEGVLKSAGGGRTQVIPLIGSFTGARLPDLATYRSSDGRLFIQAQNGSSLVVLSKGGKSDVVVGIEPPKRL